MLTFIGHLLCVRNKNSHNTPLLLSLLCSVLFCYRSGNFTWNEDWDGTQVKEKGAKGRLSHALFLIQELCHCSHSPSLFLICLSQSSLFFLAGFLCSSLLCLGPKSCANPPIHSLRAFCLKHPTLAWQQSFPS